MNVSVRLQQTSWLSVHSKPWIDRDISDQLKLLRQQRRKCRLRRSQTNVAKYHEMLEFTIELIQKVESEWWQSECERLATLNEYDKWKLINKLTNQSNSCGIQPIRKFLNGKLVYLFDDEAIRSELEDYHIRKLQLEECVDQHENEGLKEQVKHLISQAKKSSGNLLMDAEISDHEVKCTFGKGSDTPGPDGISAKLIDRADRDLMHQCLKIIWNKAWIEGNFPSDWKYEDPYS